MLTENNLFECIDVKREGYNLCPKNTINQFFPLIVCLNLQRREDRWQKMQTRFTQLGIKAVQRYIAIDGAAINIPSSWPASAGAYGCLLSHVKIVEQARDSGVSSVLIFEDDVEFSDHFNERAAKILTNLPADWQMLFFGAIQLEDPVVVSSGLQRLTKAYSTYAYAIHHSLFDAFIELNKYSTQLLDINSFILQKTFNCYCANPFLAWVETGYSDAQEKIENHWYLRESLILFGHSANALLAKTCVFIAVEQNCSAQALDNLYFLLDYYFEYFQGYLSVCVIEHGDKSCLDEKRIPGNTRHLLIPFKSQVTAGQTIKMPGSPSPELIEQLPQPWSSFKDAVRQTGDSFEYYVLSNNNLYLESMDFRANLAMCQRYDATSGFDLLIELDNENGERLKANSHAKGLDLSKNKKIHWQVLHTSSNTHTNNHTLGCYYFVRAKAFNALLLQACSLEQKVNENTNVNMNINTKTNISTNIAINSACRLYHAPNRILALQDGGE